MSKQSTVMVSVVSAATRPARVKSPTNNMTISEKALDEVIELDELNEVNELNALFLQSL